MLPQPVLIIGTYDKNGKPNAMNAAWGGMLLWLKTKLASNYATSDLTFIMKQALNILLQPFSYRLVVES